MLDHGPDWASGNSVRGSLHRLHWSTSRFGKTDAAPIITAHLAGETTAAGMLFERQGILFRHIDLAFDIWKGNKGHLISS